MSPLALLHACMLVITDAIMKTTTIMSRIAIMIVVVASDRGEGRGVPEVTDTALVSFGPPEKSTAVKRGADSRLLFLHRGQSLLFFIVVVVGCS